ncbi:hypothetical protein CC85DRAFT_161277 [Cutaneotrichosporon oleaginosum]|uniref:Uncharacterized protein n=1 Tax=Cutaneotrichosporon oleaginosum TaxID=879819 RepID=A0A0J0XGJ2_9TREE|nr:uncharacterized protein CC85DRAFT_161277 [Cutaneotrichosporon oleaginosum]KLT40220.1 hypothetical protein CC85DRAFT_161277 [Cutaneotrichosporon oleaginosum]TXT10490.1 hypothetical protein COLE_04424 [Cutaneotrichosporon oleaginosum]
MRKATPMSLTQSENHTTQHPQLTDTATVVVPDLLPLSIQHVLPVAPELALVLVLENADPHLSVLALDIRLERVPLAAEFLGRAARVAGPAEALERWNGTLAHFAVDGRRALDVRVRRGVALAHEHGCACDDCRGDCAARRVVQRAAARKGRDEQVRVGNEAVVVGIAQFLVDGNHVFEGLGDVDRRARVALPYEVKLKGLGRVGFKHAAVNHLVPPQTGVGVHARVEAAEDLFVVAPALFNVALDDGLAGEGGDGAELFVFGVDEALGLRGE